MLMKIVPKQLNEIKEYQNIDYLAFREQLFKIFEIPDKTTAYLGALAAVTQYREDTISEYMHRVWLLVQKAHPTVEHASRERILLTSFMLGLYDRLLAASLAVPHTHFYWLHFGGRGHMPPKIFTGYIMIWKVYLKRISNFFKICSKFSKISNILCFAKFS